MTNFCPFINKNYIKLQTLQSPSQHKVIKGQQNIPHSARSYTAFGISSSFKITHGLFTHSFQFQAYARLKEIKGEWVSCENN